MENVLTPPAIHNTADLEAFLDDVLARVKQIREEMKEIDARIAVSKEETDELTRRYRAREETIDQRIGEMNALLARLFPDSPLLKSHA